MMKHLVLGFMLYMFLSSASFAQTVWVPVYQPQPVVVQVQPAVVMVPVVAYQPYYQWTPCWKRWWSPYYYQPVYYAY